MSAEPIPSADRLLRLVVDTGSDTRTIVAGIAQAYPAEDLAGKQIVLVANLQPARIRGIESCGMLLAALDPQSNTPVLIAPMTAVPTGSRVS
ncbi:hypothetical protein JXA88_16345 [Candidatus Fermentibacteria bacterium]|nr:hypothetical protein [Candidatus Fermentibacteria bacterium]